MMLSSNRPNIMCITTDQQRFDTLAVLGGHSYRTPQLDRLARQGVLFPLATTPCPVCAPARWSIVTGQYPGTHGCLSNHHHGQRPAHDLPTLLRQAGYITGHVGKNHTFLTTDDFDWWGGLPTPLDQQAASLRRLWETEQSIKPWRLSVEPAPGGVNGDPQTGITNAAQSFLHQQSANQPWFLHVSYLYPHTPYLVPEPYFTGYVAHPVPLPQVEPQGLAAAGKPFRQQFHQANNDALLPYDSQQVLTMRRLYHAMVEMIDHLIGQLLHTLDATGQSDNTLVLFTSDHGDYQGDHGLFTKSPALYDCLVRVPMILRWPGGVPAGQTDLRFASLVDLLPTFCTVAGATVPTSVQGENLLQPSQRCAALAEYGVPGQAYDWARLKREGIAPGDMQNPHEPGLPWEANPVSLAGTIRMMRTQRWKLIADAGGDHELYDLHSDPHELSNLAHCTSAGFDSSRQNQFTLLR